MDAFPAMYLSKEDVEAQVTATEANIRRITTQIHELDRARQKERRTLARLWFMIVPLGKLPIELLVEIFALTVQESDSADDGMVADPIQQLLLLSEVCSTWRQTVIGSPKLWAEAMVDVRLAQTRHSPEDYVDGLKMLLNRSAPLPISVSLAHSDGVDYTAIFAAMMPTVSRWKNLSLDSYSFGDLSYLDLTPGSFTALETLNLVICSGWPRQIEPFSLCPRLRHLTLKNVGDRLGHDVLQLPWAQLTHLDLRHYALPTCCFILLQCTNLVSAKLTIRGSGTADLHVPARVLPFLKTLEVEFIRMGDFVERVGPLFIALSVPSLQNFALAANVVWPAEEFSSFQMRAPNIAQISLESCLITCQELVTLLRLTPALIALKLKWCKNCMDDEFVQAFAYDETRAQRLVPRLQKLDWQPMNEMNKYLGAFEAAIRSRGWTSNTAPPNVAQLRMVKVTSLRRIPRHWMQDLVEQGLELHLS